MKRLIPTLKTTPRELKVFALVLQTVQGAILHLGIHHSLEEAVREATPELVGLEGLVECLEGNPFCEFSLSFGYSWFCQCPIRVYVAKELGK